MDAGAHGRGPNVPRQLQELLLGGPADVPVRGRHGGTSGSRLEQVPGWRLVVLGHRPPELGGYDPENPVAKKVRDKLAEVIVGLHTVHPDLVVLTGIGLGAEMLGAEAAQLAGVPYVAVVAYPNPDALWPPRAQRRYRRLVSKAHATLTLSSKHPRTKQEAGKAAGTRNSALVAAAHGALVVWDGVDRELGSVVTALERRAPDDIWLIAPT
jgi:uncharacterized phage-like protein YoqJ